MKKTRICALLLVLAMLLAGCRLGPSSPDSGSGPAITDPTTQPATVPTTEAVKVPTEPATVPTTAPVTVPTEPATVPTEPVAVGIHDGHKPGDQFPMTILLEGMEESVMARHYVSPAGDYQMDYFYEDFLLEETQNGQDYIWRGPEDMGILGYMCITVTPGLKAQDQAQLICARMNAQAERTVFAGFEGLTVSATLGNSFVTHYIFDTPKGCVEIETSCIIEGLEGIGARMHAMLSTFEMLP